MFFRRSKSADETLFLIVRRKDGMFNIVMGDSRRSFMKLEPAMREAQRLASKLNDGQYFVMQAVAVSQVESPQAVTRRISTGNENLSTRVTEVSASLALES
jgi:hypothetical protein